MFPISGNPWCWRWEKINNHMQHRESLSRPARWNIDILLEENTNSDGVGHSSSYVIFHSLWWVLFCPPLFPPCFPSSFILLPSHLLFRFSTRLLFISCLSFPFSLRPLWFVPALGRWALSYPLSDISLFISSLWYSEFLIQSIIFPFLLTYPK